LIFIAIQFDFFFAHFSIASPGVPGTAPREPRDRRRASNAAIPEKGSMKPPALAFNAAPGPRAAALKKQAGPARTQQRRKDGHEAAYRGRAPSPRLPF
jgi:hypothetical protein